MCISSTEVIIASVLEINLNNSKFDSQTQRPNDILR